MDRFHDGHGSGHANQKCKLCTEVVAMTKMMPPH